jgi:hypothetical protein
MIVLIAFAALTIDVGYMYSVRLDLQNAADAAALTAAGAYASDEAFVMQTSAADSYAFEIQMLAYQRAATLAHRNASMGVSATVLHSEDIIVGRIDPDTTAPLDVSAASTEFNAVYVRARRDDDSANGSVEFFFAPIFGRHRTNVTASAVAAVDDRAGGVRPAVLIPFTIHRDVFESERANGDDEYQFDEDAEAVSSGSDGIREIHLYPYSSTAGNFGLLNIGGASSSGSEISTQIEDGITADELEMSFGERALTFTTPTGDIENHLISGNSGLHASLENDLETRLGEVVGIFLHDASSGSGAGTTYQISGVRFVRIMAVNLGGRPRYLKVQPAIYIGDGVILDPDAPSTGGLIGQVILAR